MNLNEKARVGRVSSNQTVLSPNARLPDKRNMIGKKLSISQVSLHMSKQIDDTVDENHASAVILHHRPQSLLSHED